MKFAKLSPTDSIKKRLSLYLGGGLLGLWLLTALANIAATTHEINEMADSQMAKFASSLQYVAQYHQGQLLQTDLDALLPHNKGSAKDEHSRFAVWDAKGKLLMTDDHGIHIPFERISGFDNEGSLLQGDSWRYVYLYNPNNGQTVAVGQSLWERFSIIINTLWIQFSLTLLMVPVLLWLVAYGIRQGLSPLVQLTDDLSQKDSHHLQAVSENVPEEMLPVVRALNELLQRLESAMDRERRFVADAAHELRSPLAALKVQTDVLAMSEDDEQQQHHLSNIKASIERASRLTEQLLVLSRLDPMQALPDTQVIDWQSLCQQVLQSINLAAREKHIKLKLAYLCSPSDVLPLQGNALLLELLLRNLLDNAIRYSPPHTQVTLTLDLQMVQVCDEGTGIDKTHLPFIKERFYRPAGQKVAGSGLGLSIVESIAALHGLALTLTNQPQGGLCVRLTPKSQT